MERIYLDYAATTPVDPEVLRAMQPYFTDIFGNASSIHSFGQEARKGMEAARETLASFLGAKAEEVVFTSGGTESNNAVIFGVANALKNKGNHIITSSIEHHAVLEPCKFLEKQGYKVTYLKVDKTGLVDPADVKKAITKETILITVMHANNEIGSIEPIEEISKIAKENGVYMHTDAVQTVGHIPINVTNLGIDMLSLSAHKFYGPKGVGAFYIKKGTKFSPYLRGGDQERGRRASTSNVAGIVGLGKAVELCGKKLEEEVKIHSELRDFLIKEISEKIPECCLNGHAERRLPNNVNFSFSYIEGESILLNLDLLGIAASTGSACTSSSLSPSHVLLAIGLSHEIAHGSLRLTLGRFSRKTDAGYLLEHLPKIVDKLRRMSPLYEPK
ncbi:MAG: cysteine desulfurase NifS [Candidatus Omnitrophota bacterium]|nr:cysteine desulfurase NifS [Candidatus Omnitrophota bacterium]